MKLFVDDVRPCPDGWMLARTVSDAQLLLATGEVTRVSLDHDMGACDKCKASGADVGDMQTPESTFCHWCPHAVDGTFLARWMVEHGHVPPEWSVHSMNPVGRKRMVDILSQPVSSETP